MLFDVVNLSSCCNFDGRGEGPFSVKMTEFAQFVVAFVESRLLLGCLMFDRPLSMSESDVTHFTFPTRKTSVADFTNVGCSVDGGVVDVVGNWCIRWKSSTDYDVIQAAIAAISDDRWLSEDSSAPLTRMEDRF